MSKTNLILHAGMHKTGSTYIQVQFAQNRNVLMKNGVLYPKFDDDNIAAHHEVAWFFEDPNGKTGNYAAAIRSGADKASTMILSSEEFSRLDEESLLALNRSLCNEFTIKPVLYLRHWGGRLHSWWNQLMRYGDSISFPEYCARLLRPMQFDDVDYTRVITKFTDVFGRECVRVIIFDNVIEAGEDLAVSFLRDAADVDDPSFLELDDHAPRNPSMRPYEAELLRLNNALNRSRGVNPSAAFKNNAAYQRAISAIFAKRQLEPDIQEFAAIFRDKAKTFELSKGSQVFRFLEDRLRNQFGDIIINAGNESIFTHVPREQFKYLRLEDIMASGADFKVIERLNGRILELLKHQLD